MAVKYCLSSVSGWVQLGLIRPVEELLSWLHKEKHCWGFWVKFELVCEMLKGA